MTDDRSVNWLRCQLRVACPALNSFSSYVVNNFEELNDMNDSINLKGLSVLKNISFLFISRSFFIRTISIQFIVSLLPI